MNFLVKFAVITIAAILAMAFPLFAFADNNPVITVMTTDNQIEK